MSSDTVGSTTNPEPGTRNQEPGTRNPEPGTRNQEPRTWNLELGTWNLELEVALMLPSIDDQTHAGDPARAWRQEKHDGIRNFIRSPQPAPRNGLEN